MIYGEMKVDQDVNGGHPLCKGEDYRNGKMNWKDSLVTAGKAHEKLYSISYHLYKIIQFTLSPTW